MKLIEIVEKLNLEIVAGYDQEDKEREINGVYIGDLLSLVMAKASSKNIWITIQSHLNVIAVANLVDLSAVLVAEAMEIDQGTIDKANELGIPLLRSKLDAYSIACHLDKMGI